MLDTLKLGVAVVDRSLTLQAWNGWLARATGIVATDAVGRPLFDVCPEMAQHATDARLRSVLETGQDVTLSPPADITGRFTDGPGSHDGSGRLRQRCTISPLRDAPDGSITGAVIAVEGAIGSSPCEQQAEASPSAPDRSTAEAERRIEMQRRLLGNVSHELRTPLNGVLGFAELLSETLEGEAGEWSRRILACARRLYCLIESVLDVSRLEASGRELNRAPVSVRALVEEVRRTFADEARDKALTLSAWVADDVPEVIQTDPEGAGQVLRILVRNALQRTERGYVTVRASADRGGGNGLGVPTETGRLRLEVADSGPGMSPEQQAAIFEPFAAGPEGSPADDDGTAFRLALCRQFAERLGGTVEVSSEGGQGSTFTLTLPLPAAPGDGHATAQQTAAGAQA